MTGYERRRAERHRAARNRPRAQGVPRPGPSVYAERFRQQGPVTIVSTHGGKWLGVERDGGFEPARPCCANPLECHRPECWWPFTAGHIY